ncbi:VOC family protein [Virgisporangium aurantiacum]|uniref:Glyoxalase-like domain-containing protein n=1 Tax=Virgisporangium aurantiacum TaxID=175570 RepID=A0A8J3ZL92_9ACTN|nr:VOC family protein [Virgisporangium aurantiacum]GIJ63548.1 hypothetical protein Vau01_110640 [Virgisporangium aurantiacum]
MNPIITQQAIGPAHTPCDEFGTAHASIGSRTFHRQQVSEPKVGKNRMHVDLRLRDRSYLDELFRLCATPISEYDGGRVLADPEGSEFCVAEPD